jgi:hypothetical protein
VSDALRVTSATSGVGRCASASATSIVGAERADEGFHRATGKSVANHDAVDVARDSLRMECAANPPQRRNSLRSGKNTGKFAKITPLRFTLKHNRPEIQSLTGKFSADQTGKLSRNAGKFFPTNREGLVKP